MTDQKTHAFRTRLDVPFEAALERVTAALKSEGFGILTSVDMQATLLEKLGAEFRQYRILGACNPPLAQEALSHDVEAVGRFPGKERQVWACSTGKRG